GRRKARLPAGRPVAEGGPLPATALRRAVRDARRGEGGQAVGEERHRGGAACLHARTHPQRRVRDPGRGPEHLDRADEDVPDPDRLRFDRGGHRRPHPDRPAAPPEVRAEGCAGRAARRGRHRLHLLRGQGRGAAPAGGADRQRLRRARPPGRGNGAGRMTRGPTRLDVSVGYALPRAGIPAATSFRKWVAAALAGRIREADLAIRIVDAKEGRALNRHYRGKDYATNVLSFPAEMAEGVKLPKGVRMPLLGDLVICAPVVAREAKEQGKALNDHYAHLTVHGVLHLLGWDHEDEREAECMEKLEREILAGLGIGDPYL